ncbi:hypothetical protein [Limimaricola litoreus]|nr:hypothetical protein [Limimaricola litoreus]
MLSIDRSSIRTEPLQPKSNKMPSSLWRKKPEVSLANSKEASKLHPAAIEPSVIRPSASMSASTSMPSKLKSKSGSISSMTKSLILSAMTRVSRPAPQCRSPKAASVTNMPLSMTARPSKIIARGVTPPPTAIDGMDPASYCSTP